MLWKAYILLVKKKPKHSGWSTIRSDQHPYTYTSFVPYDFTGKHIFSVTYLLLNWKKFRPPPLPFSSLLSPPSICVRVSVPPHTRQCLDWGNYRQRLNACLCLDFEGFTTAPIKYSRGESERGRRKGGGGDRKGELRGIFRQGVTEWRLSAATFFICPSLLLLLLSGGPKGNEVSLFCSEAKLRLETDLTPWPEKTSQKSTEGVVGWTNQDLLQ